VTAGKREQRVNIVHSQTATNRLETLRNDGSAIGASSTLSEHDVASEVQTPWSGFWSALLA